MVKYPDVSDWSSANLLSENKAEKFKILTYPSKKVVQKQSEELKLLHRPFMLGDVVRRGTSDEIGTIVAIEFESDVRVPGTNLELEKISSKRFEVNNEYQFLLFCSDFFPVIRLFMGIRWLSTAGSAK